MIFDKVSYCVEYVGEGSELKIFVTIFPHYNLLNKFFLSFHEQTIFSHKQLNKLFIFHYC